MARRPRVTGKRRKPSAPASPPAPARPATVRKPPTQFGTPFVVLEDANKNTFVYSAGVWVAHSMSIAECRQSCQVKELPQKVNNMSRYEVRCPVSVS
jgi:hypothetical protein